MYAAENEEGRRMSSPSESNERHVMRWRCGWCGRPTREDATTMAMSEIGLTKDIEVLWSDAKLVNGECCANEIEDKDQHEYWARMNESRDV